MYDNFDPKKEFFSKSIKGHFKYNSMSVENSFKYSFVNRYIKKMYFVIHNVVSFVR